MAVTISSRRKPKKAVTAKPWLRLPVRPQATDEDVVRLYRPKAKGGHELVAEVTEQATSLPVELDLDAAATVTIAVADPAGAGTLRVLLDANEDQLLDGIDVQWKKVWWRLARIDRADDGWTLTCEDRVAAWMREHDRPVKESRRKTTRAEFVYRLVRAVKKGGGIATYIPELHDKQRIAEPEEPKTKKDAAKAVKSSAPAISGWGPAASKVKVKRRLANSAQLRCLDAVLTEAHRLGASRRVLIAVVMCVTQETNAGLEVGGNSIAPDVRGPFQQRTNAQSGWTRSVRSAMDPTASCKRFLTGGDRGAPGWKQKHGSVRNGSGNLGQMVDAVQVANTPGAFGQWEKEATKTVELWLQRNAGGTSTSSSDGAAAAASYYKAQYAFRTGAAGNKTRSNYWDATGQLAEEVNWHRWACANTISYASDNELIRGTPVMSISREMTEAHGLTWSWDHRREASELVVEIALKDTWSLMPGMVVMVDDEGPVDGRWIVQTVRIDSTTSNIAEVTLRRRGAKKLEPAPQLRQRDTTSTIGGKTSYGASSKVVRNPAGSPKRIIDEIVLPVARKHGIDVTAASVAAANARHGATLGGNRSDHQGPPSDAWAADMSNGSSPTPQMDALARELGQMFKMQWKGSGTVNSTYGGYRFQMLYRMSSAQAGNHFNHVHFGVRRV